MPQHLKFVTRILSIFVLSVVLPTVTSPVAAQGAKDAPADKEWSNPTQEPRLEFFLSSIFANSTSEGSFGVRGALPLRGRFHLEGSVSRVDVSDVDLWLVDLSAKYYLRDRERTDVYLVAGHGLFYSSDLDAEEATLHLGIGVEIALGRRFYIRPELRGRWFTQRLGDSNLGDLSVGFGWRL